MSLPKCFLKYRDDLNDCLKQEFKVCRICKEATFIVLRQVQDARIAARAKTLKECLHIAESFKKKMAVR